MPWFVLIGWILPRGSNDQFSQLIWQIYDLLAFLPINIKSYLHCYDWRRETNITSKNDIDDNTDDITDNNTIF